MKNILKYIGTLAVAACLGMGAAQAGTTIWGSTHRSVSATNRIPVDTGSSSSPGYNSTADVVDTMTGDCTSTAAAVTCTKTGGVSFGALATLNLSATGGASQVLQQTTVGGAVTVGQLALKNLSDAKTDYLDGSDQSNNIYVGLGAGFTAVADNNTNNTALGYQALYTMDGSIQNTMMGSLAGTLIQDGGNNTGVGYSSLSTLTAGSLNTAIGANAQAYAATAVNTITIGANATAPADNTIQIGTNGTTYTDAYFSDGTTKLHADGSLLTAVNAATVTTINGLISQGTNVTITGTGTALDPYVIAASGSLGSSFDSISSGTNTTAAMVVDTGASIAASGSGTIAATSSLKGTTVAVSNNAAYYPIFVASSSNGNQPFNLGTALSYNPSSDTLTASTFSGALSGNASTATSATTATNATNVGVTNDTTTNATMYPTWVTANTGNLPAKTTSTKLTFNPSTGMLSSTGFTGALTGNASTVTNGVYTTDTGSVTNTMLGGSIALSKLATQATNTVVGNATSGIAAPTALAVGTCSTAGSALNWTTNTGFGCNTSITAAAVPANGLTGATLSSSVTASSLVSTGTLTGGATGAGFTVALGSSTITGTLPAANNETNLRHTSIGATFNGGGSAIAANSKQWVYVPYGTTIQSSTIACDQSGSIVFDVQMDTYANFSTAMTSIVASAPPTVSSAQKAQDATLTGWTVAIPAGDYILFKVTSATTVTNCNIVLDTIRT